MFAFVRREWHMVGEQGHVQVSSGSKSRDDIHLEDYLQVPNRYFYETMLFDY